MQYIDKSPNREEGNSITEAYLGEIYIEDEHRYPVDYDGSFRSLPSKQNSYYRQMTNVLLQNQHCYCSYCMRRLTGQDDTTLEHIVPQAATLEDYEKYRKDEFPYLKDHLKLSGIFSKEESPELDPYPHTVAYDNLVASCKGLFPRLNRDNEVVEDESGHCCNNVRGFNEALPIYFLPNVSKLIRYQKNGSIIIADNEEWHDAAEKTKTSAKLTWKSLTEIRQLWYVLKDIPKDEITSCNDEKKRLDLIQDNLYLTNINQKDIDNLINKFTKKEYWNVFLLYDWFHAVEWDEQ